MLAKLEIITIGSKIQSFAYDEAGELCYHLEDNRLCGLGAIYRLRVNQINKKSKFAYVDYADGLQGVINLRNVNVQPGSYLFGQMTWAGDEDKLPKFSEEIKLLGKYVILLKDTCGHLYAKELKNKEALCSLSARYPGLGIIFRSQINFISNNDLVINEIRFLEEQLSLVHNWPLSMVGRINAPNYKFMQLLRESKLSDQLEIVTNSQHVFDYLLPYLELWQLDSISLDEAISIHDKMELVNRARDYQEFSLEVHKLSGINLIDVNSKKSRLDFSQINYLSVDEIVRRIYLLDMTGIILIDFIKNMVVAEKEKISNRLIARLADDWRQNQILGFTRAGIFEIIRNK